jgi:hypothetical protein
VLVAETHRTVTGIAEFDENPLVNRLPPVPSLNDVYGALERVPRCAPHELALKPHLRQALVILRLKKAFVPTAEQTVFASQIHHLIRAGYDGVSLSNTSYAGRLAECADAVEAGTGFSDLGSGFRPTAYSGTLIGPSGMGKTTIVGRTLDQLPQVIRHVDPVTVDQIVHLRLECPSTGSPKQLCLSFFAKVDELVGTEYFAKFGKLTTEHMVLRMAQVAQIHRLGLLVVDEIQFLRSAKIAEDDVLNLLTTLVNVINVPVLLVGTMAAVPLLTSTFRNARRGEGHASSIFEPMKRGPEWERFLKVLFTLQWTSETTELTPELSEALFDESQGIVDIVVKIFTLAQLRLMRRSETRNSAEIIKPSLIRQIGKEDLRLVRPMLRALASRSNSLAKYDDLRPLEQQFEEIVSGFLTGGVETELPAAPTAQPVQGASCDAPLRTALEQMGYAPDVAEIMIAEARKKVSSEDPTHLLMAVVAVARGYNSAGSIGDKASRRERNPKRRTLDAEMDPSDLRTIGAASSDAAAVHAQMLSVGVAGGISGWEAA